MAAGAAAIAILLIFVSAQMNQSFVARVNECEVGPAQHTAIAIS